MSGLMRNSNMVESKFMNTSQLNKDIKGLHDSKRQQSNQLGKMQKELDGMKGQRKYEGYDYPQEQSQVHKPKQVQQNNTIEKEYIQGLQDEIKYLEYELKLLKDKEIDQQQQYSQLDKFFQDGVPLNENILQMKNQYNAVKAELTGQLHRIQQDQVENRQKIHDIQVYNEKVKTALESFQVDWEGRQGKYVENLNELRRRYFNDKHYNALLEGEHKGILKKLRAMQQQIIQFNRANEKEIIMAGKMSDKINGKKVEQENRQIELEREKKGLQDKLKEITRMTVPMLQSKILENERSLLHMQKDLNLEKNKQLEYNDTLMGRKKERESIVMEVNRLRKRIIKRKEQIEKENEMNDMIIQKRVEEQLRNEEENLAKQVWDNRQNIALYFERIRRLETHNENLIESNYEQKQQIIDEGDNANALQGEYAQVRDQMVINSNKFEVQKLYVQEVTQRFNKAQEQYLEDQVKLEPVQQNIKQSAILIDKYMKQKQMIKQFRNFNVEELKMLASSNQQINQQINGLINKWEQISHRV